MKGVIIQRAQYCMVKIKETDAWNLTAECVGKAIGSTQEYGKGKLCALHTLRGENP